MVGRGDKVEGIGKTGEEDQEVQNSSFKTNKSQEWKVQYGEYSQFYCNTFIQWKVVTTLILKSIL